MWPLTETGDVATTSLVIITDITTNKYMTITFFHYILLHGKNINLMRGKIILDSNDELKFQHKKCTGLIVDAYY